MAVEYKVKKIIAEKLKCDINQIVPHAEIINDLGADSISMMDLMMNIENEFDLDIAFEEAEKLATVQDIVNYVEGYC